MLVCFLNIILVFPFVFPSFCFSCLVFWATKEATQESWLEYIGLEACCTGSFFHCFKLKIYRYACLSNILFPWSDFDIYPINGPEENLQLHSTASMYECSKDVHQKLNVLENHENFQTATNLEACEKNSEKTFNWHQPDNCQECSHLSSGIGNLECPITDLEENLNCTEKWLQLKCS